MDIDIPSEEGRAAMQVDSSVSSSHGGATGSSDTGASSSAPPPPSFASFSQKRIRPTDSDQIQADTFDVEAEDLTNTTNLYDLTVKKSTTDPDVSSLIADFLVISRNLFEPSRPSDGSEFWNEDNVHIPLESDELAIDYLSQHQYDVPKALFHLSVEMGCGKEYILSSSVQYWVSKCPQAGLFTEFRDKFYKAENQMFGIYKNSGGSHASMSMAVDGELRSPSASGGSISPLDGHAGMMAVDESSSSSLMVTHHRAARTGEKDRLENRKKWSDLNKALSETNRKEKNNSNSNSNSNSNTTSGKGSKSSDDPRSSKSIQSHQHSTIQGLVDQCVVLSSNPTSNIFNNLSHVSTSGDQELSDSLRTVLGDSIKDMLEIRKWSGDVRDFCYLAQSKHQHKLNTNYGLQEIKVSSTAAASGTGTGAPATVSTEAKVGSSANSNSNSNSNSKSNSNNNSISISSIEQSQFQYVPFAVLMKTLQSFYNEPIAVKYNSFERKQLEKIISDLKHLHNEVNMILGKVTPLPPDFKRPTLYEAHDLLTSYKSLPIETLELIELGGVIEAAENVVSRCEELFIRAQNCKLKKAKASARTRFSIDVAQGILKEAEKSPVDLSTVIEPLKVLVNTGLQWSDDAEQVIISLNNMSTSGSASNQLKKSSSSSSSSSSSKGSSHSSGASLVKIESLIAECESLPFAFPQLLEQLKEKHKNAIDRLLKLKTSISAKFNSNAVAMHRRSRVDNPHAVETEPNGGKINLAEMRDMVQESEFLLQAVPDEGGEEGEKRAKASHLRELNKAQSVLSMAEEWLERVRDVFNSPVADGDKNSDDEMEENEKGEEERYSDSLSDMISNLNDMLQEAESMPVMMDEIPMLKSYVQALQWSQKLRSFVFQNFNNSTMTLAPDTLKFISSRDSDDDVEVPINPRDLLFFRKAAAVIKYTDCLKYSRDILKIRASVGDKSSSSSAARPLSEENFITDALTAADDFLVRLKKVIQTSSDKGDKGGAAAVAAVGGIKKGATAAAIQKLLESAKTVPLNLESDLKPLKQVMQLYSDWQKKNKLPLAILGIQNASYVTDEGVKSSNDVSGASMVGSDDENEASSADVSQALLNRMISTGSALGIEFPELNKLKDLQGTVDDWMAHCRDCASRKSTRKPTKKYSSATGNNSLIPLKRILSLIDNAPNLNINVDSEVKKLQDIVDSCESLNVTFASKIAELDESKLQFDLDNYVDLVSTSTMGRESASTATSCPYFEFLNGSQTSITSPSQLKSGVAGSASSLTWPVSKAFAEFSAWRSFQQSVGHFTTLREEGDLNGVLLPSLIKLYKIDRLKDWIKMVRFVCVKGRFPTNEAELSKDAIVLSGDSNGADEERLFSDFVAQCKLDVAHRHDWGDMSLKALELLRSCVEDLISGSNQEVVDSCFYSNSILDRAKYVPELPLIDLVHISVSPSAMAASNDMDTKASAADGRSGDDVIAMDVDDGAKEKEKEKDSSASVNNRRKSGGSLVASAKESSSAARSRLPRSKDLAVADAFVDQHQEKDEKSKEKKEGGANFEMDWISDLFNNLQQYLQEEDSDYELPKTFQMILGFWASLLDCLISRVHECHAWSNLAASASSKGASSSAPSKEEVGRMISYATQRSLSSKVIRHMQSVNKECEDWYEKCRLIKSKTGGDQLLTFDEVKVFMSSGETLFGKDIEELSFLRTEVKKGRQWVSRFQRLPTDNPSASAFDNSNNELMRTLVQEADSIHINLQEFLEPMNQALRLYCLCRQPFHGQMIGCDSCDDWFHLSCANVSKMQADKIDKYCCIRCALTQSFQASAKQAAHVVNQWMNPDDFRKNKDTKRSKITKRIHKEEKDIKRIEEILGNISKARAKRALFLEASPVAPPLADASATGSNSSGSSISGDLADQSAMQVDHNINEIMENSPKSTSAPVPLPGMEVNFKPTLDPKLLEEEQVMFKTASSEILECKSRLSKAVKEDTEFRQQDRLEESKFLHCQGWMHGFQQLIWPQNDENYSRNIEEGRPLGPSNPPGLDVEFLLPSHAHFMRSMVPESIRRTAEVAVKLGIDKIDDVIVILECFRWMNWCSVTLHSMRSPLSTKALNRLIAATKTLRYADDKIIKQLTATLAKSVAWKTRARKLIVPDHDYLGLDNQKLASFVIESNATPFLSRMKDLFRAIYDEKVNNGSISLQELKVMEESIYNSDELVGLSGSGGAARRGRQSDATKRAKEKEKDAAAAASSAAFLVQAVLNSNSSMDTTDSIEKDPKDEIQIPMSDVCFTSDDELGEQGEDSRPVTRLVNVQNLLTPAAPPPEMWPPTLHFDPIPRVMPKEKEKEAFKGSLSASGAQKLIGQSNMSELDVVTGNANANANTSSNSNSNNNSNSNIMEQDDGVDADSEVVQSPRFGGLLSSNTTTTTNAVVKGKPGPKPGSARKKPAVNPGQSIQETASAASVASVPPSSSSSSSSSTIEPNVSEVAKEKKKRKRNRPKPKIPNPTSSVEIVSKDLNVVDESISKDSNVEEDNDNDNDNDEGDAPDEGAKNDEQSEKRAKTVEDSN